jgi:membrane-bound serine protease (ClpP class)
MKVFYFFRFLNVLFFLTVNLNSLKASDNPSTYVMKNLVTVTVDSSINPATLSYLESAFKKAQSQEGGAILLKLSTPGGLVSTTKKILQLIGEAHTPTLIWITPESASATSAGALIAAGAHFLFMSPGTNIGAATPIDMSAENLGEDLRSKAINDLVALITSLSQTRGRNGNLFAKMVTDAASYTSEEARKEKIIDFLASDLEEEIFPFLQGKTFILKGHSYIFQLENPNLINLDMDLGQKILNVFADPNIAYLLFLMGAALLYFELQAPGGLILGGLGAFLLLLSGISFQVLPLNFGALALLLLAFLLFILEAYVTSYGVLSLAGLVSLSFGSLFLFRTEDSYMTVSHHLILAAVGSIALFLILIGGYLFKDFRRRTPSEDYYSKKGKTVLIFKVLGMDEETKQYKYLVKTEGEIWSAHSEKKFEKDSHALVSNSDQSSMSLYLQ